MICYTTIFVGTQYYKIKTRDYIMYYTYMEPRNYVICSCVKT